MNELHNENLNGENFVPKEGAEVSLCSNEVSPTAPSLAYDYLDSPDKLNKAFDILFEEVFRLNNITNNYEPSNKISGILCKSINI
jgi:hypothetical protein